MKGRVYAYGDPCPCGGEWRDVKDGVTGDVVNIVCASCFRAPSRFAIDGRSFRNRKGTVGRIFRDKRDVLFYYFGAAHQMLQAIREDWGNDPIRFNPTKWSNSGRRSHKVSECGTEWIQRLKDAGKSKGYQVHAELFFRRHINPVLGEIDIRELTSADIEKLQTVLREKNLSPQSVKSALQALMSMLVRNHYRRDVLAKIPAFPEGWSNVPKAERYIVDEATQRMLWLRMKPDTHLLMETYCALGCRPEEVCALKRRDLLPDGTVLIQRAYNSYRELKETKTGDHRVCEIPANLHARLCALPVLPDAFLFARGGKPFNPNRLSSAFRCVAKDYPQVTLYTLSRHSMATRVKRAAEKRGIEEAARRLGNTAEVAKAHYIQ